MKEENNKGIRVAMISYFSDPLSPMGGRQVGGASIYILELAKSLSKEGIKIDIFTRLDNRHSAKEIRLNNRLRVIRISAGPRHFVAHEEYSKYLPEFIEKILSYKREKRLDYDIIHTHQHASGLIGIRLKYILKAPMVHTFHSLGRVKIGALSKKSQIKSKEMQNRFNVEEKIIENSERIIATSPQEKLNIIRLYKNDGDNIAVIPPGINLNRFTPLSNVFAREKLNIPIENINKKIIVFAARMDENKGLAVLVDAIKIIKSYYPKIFSNLKVYVFAGDPRKNRQKERVEQNYRNKIVNQIAKNKLGQVMELSAAIDQDKLHYYYSAANVVAMPSYYESFGLVAVEAMASGTPVVASDVGGLKWTIKEGINGYRSKVKDPKALAQAMLKILKNPSLEKRMGENAAIIANQEYNWGKISKNIIKEYREIIPESNRIL